MYRFASAPRRMLLVKPEAKRMPSSGQRVLSETSGTLLSSMMVPVLMAN